MAPQSSRRLAAGAYAGGPLRSELPAQTFKVGHFRLSWSGEATGRVVVAHEAEPERALWQNVARASFLTAGLGSAKVSESRGFFQIKEKLSDSARSQVIESCVAGDECLELSGSFSDRPKSTWRICFRAVDDRQFQMEASASIAGRSCNRLCFVVSSQSDEEFYGFGAQFTFSHFKGRRVPVLCQEPGIGRGIQPLTTVMRAIANAGGHWWNSYAPVPMFLSTEMRGFCLENCEYSVFDLKPQDSLRIGAFTEALVGRVFYGVDPPALLEAYTRFCGRMRMLPQWAQQGAIIGMQGGTAAVRQTLARLEEQNTQISAFWLQDWVGKRKTAIGTQLWWTWELDREQYPEWEELVSDLRKKTIRVLTYLNPFVVDATGKRSLSGNLHTEAQQKGYFVRGHDGKPYAVKNTTFSASLLDLTNPECRTWFKNTIKEHSIGVGSSGWMADYAEALPFDALLHSRQDAAQYHNEYPIEWAKINREAIAEAGLEDDALFFTRSGYHCSPAHSTCFWLGDQLTSWRQEDGIKSVVVGLVSSGLSGMTINHGDIGGYTTTHVLPFHVPYVSYCRSQELLLRWIELSAFTAIFRTHEGNNPRRNHQITDDPGTLAHFSRFSRVYAALATYRTQLCEEAAERGMPIVRHPWVHFPQDKQVRRLTLQYLLGADIMVAPVLDRGSTSVRLYLPAGTWVHLWSQQEVLSGDPGSAEGGWFVCKAPIGSPPVFCRADQPGVAVEVRAAIAALAASGDLGHAWSETACTPECGGKSKSWGRMFTFKGSRNKAKKDESLDAPLPPVMAWPEEVCSGDSSPVPS